MLNLVRHNLKEKRLIDSEELKEDYLGIHYRDNNSNFYVKIEDLENPITLKYCEVSNPEALFFPPVINIKFPALEYCISKGGYLGSLGELTKIINYDFFHYKSPILTSTISGIGVIKILPKDTGVEYVEDFMDTESIVIPFFPSLKPC